MMRIAGRFTGAIPAVAMALISHAGVCPACWPLVGGLMSSLGATFLIETRFLLPVMIACLLVGAYVWSFWLRQSRNARSCRGCASSANRADTINPPARNLELPIACALDQAQFAERKRLVERLAEQATERQTLPNGVRLRFEAIAGRATELAKFVDMERSCCPFLTFRIDANPGDCISLELTGPIPAQEIIRELIPEIVR